MLRITPFCGFGDRHENRTVALCLLVAGSPAQAAYYEVTVQGQVTAVYSWPNVSVGDPFTVRYVVDSTDLDPSPTVGIYSATEATVTFPRTSDRAHGFSPQEFVALPAPDGAYRVGYGSSDYNDDFWVAFTFPAGTITSDIFPGALPLESATSAEFIRAFFVSVEGIPTSYASTEIPEPSSAVLAPPVLIIALRRRRSPAWTSR